MKSKLSELTPLVEVKYDVSFDDPTSVVITPQNCQDSTVYSSNFQKRKQGVYLAFSILLIVCVSSFLFFWLQNGETVSPIVKSAGGGQKMPLIEPYSSMDPLELGLLPAIRYNSKPGEIFANLYNVPLPTNSWCQNLLLGATTSPENRVFQVPFIIDTASEYLVREMIMNRKIFY
jgi:hypothetical protein